MPSSAWCRGRRDLHSFPTRRSSDLALLGTRTVVVDVAGEQLLAGAALALNEDGDLAARNRVRALDHAGECVGARDELPGAVDRILQDRKSTRLNSSHRCISYAVFCMVSRAP